MAERMTVARYDDMGGFAALQHDVITMWPIWGPKGHVTVNVVDRGDGTATVTASGPSDMVYSLIEYVDINY